MATSLQKWVWLESPSHLGGSIISAHGLESWAPGLQKASGLSSLEGGGDPSYIHLTPNSMQGHFASL